MSEILTESFCERCGTRYTFESARPKTRLKGVKVLSLGLKNFVLSDETSLDEAMAAARSEADRELTAHQLDAFHKTFNFCMSCRQYTCPNCWNETDARCLSCSPLPGQAAMPVSLPGLSTLAETTVVAEPSTNGAKRNLHDAETALRDDVIFAGPGLTEPEAAAAVEPVAEVIAASPEVIEPEAAAAVEPAGIEAREKAIGQTTDLLRRFRPGQSLDEELAAYERQRAAAATQAAAEPVAQAAEPVTETAETVQPAAEIVEPVAEAVPGPAEAIEAAPAVQAEPEPAVPAPAADVVEQPTWRITAPETVAPTARPPTPADVVPPLRAGSAPPPTAPPQWPARPATPALPDWPPPQASAGSPFSGQLAQAGSGAEALWAASNQELVGTPLPPGRPSSGIQPCVSCGLSLSATARFCRRCGTLQAR
jgi:hypothetical protein